MPIKGYFSVLPNIRTTVKLVDIKNIKLEHPYFYRQRCYFQESSTKFATATLSPKMASCIFFIAEDS